MDQLARTNLVSNVNLSVNVQTIRSSTTSTAPATGNSISCLPLLIYVPFRLIMRLALLYFYITSMCLIMETTTKLGARSECIYSRAVRSCSRRNKWINCRSVRRQRCRRCNRFIPQPRIMGLQMNSIDGSSTYIMFEQLLS